MLLDPFLGWLVILVVAVGFVDFFIGSEGRKKVRARIETWWLHLEYIRLPQAGREEAKFWLAVMERSFGVSFWSRQRIYSCAVFLIIVFALVYVGVELSRLQRGMSIRLPFQGMHMITNPGGNYAFLIVSIWLTHLICRISVGRVSGRFETLKFALIWLITIVISVFGAFIVETQLKVFLQRSLCWVFSWSFIACDNWDPNFSFRNEAELFAESAEVVLSWTMYVLANPDGLWEYVQYHFELLVMDKYQNAYSIAVSISIIFMRLLILLFFVVGWMAARHVHRFASTVLYRVTESEKGPLTVVAAGIAALAKVIQTIITTLM